MDKKLCPNCMDRVDVTEHQEYRSQEVHGITVEYTHDSLQCVVCDEVFATNEMNQDNYKRLYDAYRKETKMLFPEDIKTIRSEIYGLSTRDFAVLIGCSPATISRYENGALQSRQHNQQLKLLQNPENMKQLYNDNKKILSPAGEGKLEERLTFLLDVSKSASLLKGMDSKVCIEKVENIKIETTRTQSIIDFFLIKGKSEGELLTPLKLQKILYYAQGWAMGITGKRLMEDNFEAWVHGPVIREVYDRYKIVGNGGIDIEQEDIWELHLDVDHFRLLNWVWDHYGKFQAKFLESMTHEEKPWKEARTGLQDNDHSKEVIKEDTISEYFSVMRKTMKLISE